MSRVEQFGRVCELTVAPLSGGAGVSVSGLRVVFEIERTSTSEPNPATVQVYNLSEGTRGMVQDKDQAVILKAGYQDLVQQIFIGVVRRVEHRREGTEIVTELELKDGGIALLEPEFRRAYARGTSRRKIVQDIIRAMPGISEGHLSNTVLKGSISGKLALSGTCKTAMDRLARGWGFEWSVQDNVVQVLRLTGTREGRELAEVFSPLTGLIGSPSRTGRDARAGKGAAGARWASLLRPALVPGGYALIESEFLSGAFKVESVRHSGDTHGDAWQTEAEGVQL